MHTWSVLFSAKTKIAHSSTIPYVNCDQSLEFIFRVSCKLAPDYHR